MKKGDHINKPHIRAKYDTELEQITLSDQRFYKRGPETYYPSVTTILDYMPKDRFFMQWIKDVGANADIIKNRAGIEGSQVHEAAEDLMNGREVTWIDDNGYAKYDTHVWGMIVKFHEFMLQVQPKIEAVEEFIYSDIYKYAGTVDIVAIINNKRWILDIKTSNYLHGVYGNQMAAYAKAWKEIKGQDIDNIGIVWLKSSKRKPSNKEGVYQGKGWELKHIEDIDSNFESFKKIYEIYNLYNSEQTPVIKEYPSKLKLQ